MRPSSGSARCRVARHDIYRPARASNRADFKASVEETAQAANGASDGEHVHGSGQQAGHEPSHGHPAVIRRV